MPSTNKPTPSSQVGGLHSAISTCERKLEKLKILNQQCMSKSLEPRDYTRKLCRSLAYQICEELKTAVAADCASEVAEESVIHVKEHIIKTSSSQKQHNTAVRRSPRRQGASEVAPVPNEIYSGYWPMSKSWLAVLVLPLEDIETYGLSESMPPCYDRDENTGIAKWAEGYEDGGSHILDRQFPVMFLERLPRLDKNAVGWVTAKNLQSLDSLSSPASLIPHYDAVVAFMQSRRASDAENSHTNSVLEADRNVDTDKTLSHDKLITAECSVIMPSPYPMGPTSAERHGSGTLQMLRTMPDSVFLSKPVSVPAAGHSPTYYDLPPLNANQSKIAESLPTIRPLIDTTSAVKRRAIDYGQYDGRIVATYRNVAPRIKPIIDWPSLSKQRYVRPSPRPFRSRHPRSPVDRGSVGIRGGRYY